MIDKPSGLTSFDVVRRVRRRLGGVKAGHTGTLDPLATGVLPVCLGEATRIAEVLLAEDKTYLATARFGVRTDTLDTTGRTLEAPGAGHLSAAQLEAILPRFTGELDQVPPAYSAIRLGGRRAHELARRGERVELSARRVRVDEIRLIAWEAPDAVLRVHCSKGTYIRSLVRDLGEALGCGATLAALRREQSGSFRLEQCVPLEQVELEANRDGGLPIVSMDQALEHLPAFEVRRDQARALAHGRQAIYLPGQEAPLARLRCEGALVALAEVSNGRITLRRVFNAARNWAA